jgi:hypothetical protein
MARGALEGVVQHPESREGRDYRLYRRSAFDFVPVAGGTTAASGVAVEQRRSSKHACTSCRMQ